MHSRRVANLEIIHFKAKNYPLSERYNVLSRWKNYFSQLLNVHKFSDIRQTDIHTAVPLVRDPSPFENEIVIAVLKKYKSPAVIKFRQDLLKQEVKHYSLRSINSLILFGIKKNWLISGRSSLLYQFTRRAIKLTALIIEEFHCYELRMKFYPISSSLG
jgi:hypothetical protein